MEQSSRRQQNGKLSEKTAKKEEKEEGPLPGLAKLTIEDGQEKQKSSPTDSKHDKKPKRGFEDLRPGVRDTLNECFAKLNLLPTDLDPSIYDSLLDFPDPIQCEIVASFCRADLASIRNKTGYFIGILKQYRKNGKALAGTSYSAYNALPLMSQQAAYLYPPYASLYSPTYSAAYSPYFTVNQGRQTRAGDMFADSVAASGYYPYLQSYPDQLYNSVYGHQFASPYLLPQPALSPSFSKICLKAQIRLAHLYNTHIIRRTDLEDCVFDSLADFPDNEQLKMCDGFAQANLANVRNKTAFFIGILKRHRHGPGAPSAPDGAEGAS